VDDGSTISAVLLVLKISEVHELIPTKHVW